MATELEEEPLNRGQEMLSLAARLTRNPFAASLAWRDALRSSDDLSARLAQAHTLLHAHGVNQPTYTFTSSMEAMRLVVEADSCIPLRGGKVTPPDGDAGITSIGTLHLPVYLTLTFLL